MKSGLERNTSLWPAGPDRRVPFPVTNLKLDVTEVRSTIAAAGGHRSLRRLHRLADMAAAVVEFKDASPPLPGANRENSHLTCLVVLSSLPACALETPAGHDF